MTDIPSVLHVHYRWPIVSDLHCFPCNIGMDNSSTFLIIQKSNVYFKFYQILCSFCVSEGTETKQAESLTLCSISYHPTF